MDDTKKPTDAADGPRCFRDAAGRLWTLQVTIAGLKRIKALTGHAVSAMSIGELADHLGDPVNAVDVAFSLVAPVAEQRGVADVEFGEAIAGDAIEELTRCLWGALSDFSPRQTRQVMRGLAERTWPSGPTSSTSAATSPAPPAVTPTPDPSAS